MLEEVQKEKGGEIQIDRVTFPHQIAFSNRRCSLPQTMMWKPLLDFPTVRWLSPVSVHCCSSFQNIWNQGVPHLFWRSVKRGCLLPLITLAITNLLVLMVPKGVWNPLNLHTLHPHPNSPPHPAPPLFVGLNSKCISSAFTLGFLSELKAMN